MTDLRQMRLAEPNAPGAKASTQISARTQPQFIDGWAGIVGEVTRYGLRFLSKIHRHRSFF
jgi:hypothetical protein